ncbi:MAG: endonuclease MutS2 [Clostridia bacterium]|nr:endonuclease MutS2 [Clostridia bacterium]
MYLTDKTVSLLEFDKIRAMLAGHAGTEGSRRAALALMPDDDPVRVEASLKRTTDARALLNEKGKPPFGGIKDLSSHTERAEKGAMLTPAELLDVANLLRTARSLYEYGRTNRTFPTVLDEIFDRLLADKQLENRIFTSIISEDTVADEASATLADIRRKIRLTTVRIRELLSRYTGGEYAKYLQESIVTMRNGRYVIPVKAECKNEIRGLVHDTSSSGATFFIEPMAVVEANNELHTYEAKERYEIERVLYDLSAGVADAAQLIRYDAENIDELALVFACASFGESYGGVTPAVGSRKTGIRYVAARHPLIPASRVVPVDIRLGGQFDTVVITGPNTGGKTVTLKTLGLFSLMAQSGLQIPAGDGSRICVFDRILVDLGDDQSIEQSLSTFSAHMVNIVSIMQEITPDSLVLFDELGVGTDPVEGAALAVAIIEAVREWGALCAATTHYSELKSFALSTPGVTNASCEFDVETLRPTYRLTIGTPGRSCAIAISERLGLPEKIIKRAEETVSADDRRFEDILARLEKDRIEAQREREEAEAMLAEAKKARSEAEEEIQKRLSAAAKEEETAREKARTMVEGARISSEFIFSQIEKVKKAKDTEKAAEELEAARRALREHLKENEEVFNPPEADSDPGYVLPRELKKGDSVWLKNLKQTGYLLSDPDKNGSVTVQVGGLRTKTKLDNLKLAEDAVTVVDAGGNRKTPSEYVSRPVSRACSPEIDLRGMTGDEAWIEIDRYLDSAGLAGLSSVRLIHGKGTGALRAAVRSRLRDDPRVASFRSGQQGEGDTGVTVVELK